MSTLGTPFSASRDGWAFECERFFEMGYLGGSRSRDRCSDALWRTSVMTLRRKALATTTFLLAASTIFLFRSVGRAQFEGQVSSIAVDLGRPDALIRTHSLSSLPRDLLKVPLAHDLLT